MKRHNYLYDRICDLENVRAAHKKASRGKAHYREVVKVDARRHRMLPELCDMLKDMAFVTSPYSVFIKRGRKDRVIHKLPYYPDRIVHHAIMNVIEPIWAKTFIRDTYASVPGRGLHDGVRRIKTFLKNPTDTRYCLKIDVKKFYPSVDNAILKQVIRKKIKCRRTLSLLDGIIESEKGVPIGNYLSQYLANLYLSDFDHWIKETKKIRHYGRYCDDMVFLGPDKTALHQLKRAAGDFLAETRGLNIKENWQVFPVSGRGVDFLGYVFRHGHTRLRKSIVMRFKQKVRRIKKLSGRLPATQVINTLMSYYGWFLHADTGPALWNKYVDAEVRQIAETSCREKNIKNPFIVGGPHAASNA